MKSLDKKQMVSVRIPESLNKKFSDYCERIGMSKSQMIISLIVRELGRNTQKEKHRG